VPQFLRSLLASFDRDRFAIQRINAIRLELARVSDDQLRDVAMRATGLLQFMAAVAVAASRILGQEMYDVQLRGALALARGSIAEMQTGEGKTLAAVPAVAWLARERKGVHVMTANDYLAGRDARWMGDLYRFLGLSTGYVQQGMTPAERRAAYACDITYASANEIGFDVLRDRLALRLDEQVHRPFFSAVIDEVDSILIDEARIPLVIAGGVQTTVPAYAVDQVVRRLRPRAHYMSTQAATTLLLTDAGIRAEDAFWLRQLLRGTQSPAAHSPCRTRSKPTRFFAAMGLLGQGRRHRDGG
jgi:preprotein translocase subunit SecA